uniref:Uncharacterized protein n=1 Tax=Cajanus cajan TaxID=3821 RepID=A0A151RMG7_CAJCA|nr:hypothetical protein KK1_034830 [Cajanus cajan]
MVFSWILNSLTPDIADSIIFYDTAHEVWEDLQNCFFQSNAPRIFQLEKEIACLSRDQLMVAAYYTKLKELWDELGSYNDAVCTCGANNKRRKLMQFLMGLEESYSVVRGQLLLMIPLPVFHKLILPSFKKKSNEIWVQEERLLKLLPWLFKKRNQLPLLFATNLVHLLVLIPITASHCIAPTVTGIITQKRHVGSYTVIHLDSPSTLQINTIISSPTTTINLQ